MIRPVLNLSGTCVSTLDGGLIKLRYAEETNEIDEVHYAIRNPGSSMPESSTG